MIFNRYAVLSAFAFIGACGLGIQPAAAQLSGPVSSSSSQCSSGSSSSSSYCYGQFQQDILTGIVSNINTSVRDQLHQRLTMPTTRVAPLRFTGEDSEFDNHNPFAAQGMTDPFSALAYAKVYTKAPPPAPVSQWIYGANLVGSGDQSMASGGTKIGIGTVTGAFDVTKIGIFTTNDALTFIGTGSGSFAHSFAGPASQWDSSTPAASGTLSYLNGAFSADFTTLASWTSYTDDLPPALFPAPTDNSVVSLIGNAQYRFDLPYSFFIEPTGGVTYTEVYTSNFGMQVANYTELHGGARVGTEMKWMGYTVQPQLSGAVFGIVDNSISTAPIAATIIPATPNLGLGFRGSAKITVLWTPNFSSYLEGHASNISGGNAAPLTELVTAGVQAGLRYSW